jgi:hypothetical protein
MVRIPFPTDSDHLHDKLETDKTGMLAMVLALESHMLTAPMDLSELRKILPTISKGSLIASVQVVPRLSRTSMPD